MNRIQVNIRDIQTTKLQLGFEGESDHTQVVFDWTTLYASYPSAVASMTVKSPSGGLYPKELVQTGNKLLWNVSASDCAKAGSGQYQLTFTNGTEVIKTYIGSFSVNSSLLGSGDPPDPVEDWLQEAQEALAAFDQNVSDAEAWAAGTRDGEPVESTDPAYENNSKYYAEQAEAVLESIPSDYTELSEDVDALHAIKAPAIESSAGPAPIASITDGADGMPVKTLNVSIEPVQDLHGQDAPYPAGGGKNKLDTSSFTSTSYGGITYTKQTDGGIKVSGTVTDVASIYIVQNMSLTLPAGTYTLSGTGVSGIYAYLLPGYRGGTFTLDEETTFTALQMRQNTVGYTANFTYYPQLEAGSSSTPFAPYSNICPISGWTGANVTRTGKNLFDQILLAVSPNIVYENGELNGTAGAFNSAYSSNGIPFAPPDGQLTLSFEAYTDGNAGTTSIGLAISFVYADGTQTGGSIPNSAATFTKYTIVSTAGKKVSKITIGYNSIGTNMWHIRNLQIELGSTASEYTPYSGSTIEYEFPQAAGTVYGGTLTIHQDGTGELVVDRANVEYDGSVDENWSEYGVGTDHYCATVLPNNKKIGNQKSICNEFENVNAAYGSSRYGIYSDHVNLTNTYFRMPNSTVTTLAEFKSWIAQNPIQLVYEIAEPVTYQLTNQQVIALLKGVNNVWADTGNVTVEYPADTKLYIDGKIAELQALILENISNS